MRKPILAGSLLALLLGGCSGKANDSSPTPLDTPSAVSTPVDSSQNITIVTPTPSAYPTELPEDSAALVSSFSEIKLGSRQGDYLVYLQAKEMVDIGLTKRGNPAFATGANSTSPDFVGDVSRLLAENPEFREPLERVLDAYIEQTYIVPDGDEDPLGRSPEFVEQAKKLKDSLNS